MAKDLESRTENRDSALQASVPYRLAAPSATLLRNEGEGAALRVPRGGGRKTRDFRRGGHRRRRARGREIGGFHPAIGAHRRERGVRAAEDPAPIGRRRLPHSSGGRW